MNSINNKTETCQFDKPEGCYALACYSNQKCYSRDKSGNPNYVTLETIKNEKGYLR